MSGTTGIPEDLLAIETFPQFLRKIAALYGDDIAVSLKAETIADEDISYKELERKSAEMARGLIARGVGKGMRVGFICGNGPSFALNLAAIARVGAIAIPFSTMLKSDELVRVLRQSDVAGLIVQRSLLGKDYVERLCEALPGLKAGVSPQLRLTEVPYLRWVLSTGDDLPGGIEDISVLTEEAVSVSEGLLEAVESEVHASDQMIEIYTSGSMALPKGVRHNHGPAMFRTRYIAGKIQAERGKPSYAIMPMFWVGGLMIFLMPALATGGTVICGEGTSINSRFAMGVVMTDEDMARMPKMPILWALGMSETLGPYTYGDEMRAPGYPLCPPVDHVADGYDIRIADENDQPVADGEIGEMQVRGYALTPGLHKLPREPYFTPDGYYRTGDLCQVDGQRIHFVGRDGDMIKTAGSNVSPAEVEMELQKLGAVQSAYVLGLPDKDRGQIVVAAIVPEENAAPDYEMIRAEMKGRMSGYKIPREFLTISRDDLPMLPSNKVARRELARIVEVRLGRV